MNLRKEMRKIRKKTNEINKLNNKTKKLEDESLEISSKIIKFFQDEFNIRKCYWYQRESGELELVIIANFNPCLAIISLIDVDYVELEKHDEDEYVLTLFS